MPTSVSPCPFASGPLQRDLRGAARQDPGNFDSKLLGAPLVVYGLASGGSGGRERLQRSLSNICPDQGTGRFLDQQRPCGDSPQGYTGGGANAVFAEGQADACTDDGDVHLRARNEPEISVEIGRAHV